jgi:hypothetical protein
MMARVFKCPVGEHNQVIVFDKLATLGWESWKLATASGGDGLGMLL